MRTAPSDVIVTLHAAIKDRIQRLEEKLERRDYGELVKNSEFYECWRSACPRRLEPEVPITLLVSKIFERHKICAKLFKEAWEAQQHPASEMITVVTFGKYGVVPGSFLAFFFG